MMDIDFSEHFYYCETSPTGIRRIHDVPYRGKSTKFHARANDPVGTFCGRYWNAPLLKKTFLIHRIIWKLVHGSIKEGYQIDHIDGNPRNNRIENLREVIPAENLRNRSKSSKNWTGTTGVTIRHKGKYTAFCAGWWAKDGKSRLKYFAVNKFGLMPAFQMAVIFRKEMIALRNSEGAGYSDRHGTNKPEVFSPP